MREAVRVLSYEKRAPGQTLRCEVKVFGDGSAYAVGEGIEIVFEDSPDAYASAIEHLEKKGYVKVAERGVDPD